MRVALCQCIMRNRPDILYILVRVGNVELLDVKLHSGQARRALLSLRLVLALHGGAPPCSDEPGPEGARKPPSGAETERSLTGPQRLPDSPLQPSAEGKVDYNIRNDKHICIVCLAIPPVLVI